MKALYAGDFLMDLIITLRTLSDAVVMQRLHNFEPSRKNVSTPLLVTVAQISHP